MADRAPALSNLPKIAASGTGLQPQPISADAPTTATALTGFGPSPATEDR